MTLRILGEPSARRDQAQFYARQREALRTDQVDRFLAELWRLGPRVGIDPAGAAAQAAHETGVWTSALWRDQLNPAGLKTRDGAAYQRFGTGEEAAQAQLVHLAVYAKGYRGAQQMIRYLHLDERWHAPIAAGYAGKARTYDDLAGRWAEDPQYGTKVEGHWRRIQEAVHQPAPTPGTNPPSGIIYHPTGNYWLRAVDRPLFVVRHITDDLVLQHTIDWFTNPISGASSHFVIDRDGTIHQFVSTLHAAWTNGDVNRPRQDIPVLNRALASGLNFNHFCVTIEHVATNAQQVTEQQIEASIVLGRYLNARYGIPPHRYGQLRHSDVNSVTRSYCPGPGFPLERIIRSLGGDPDRLSEG
jgi:N-acetyl-anhydromuramyl-L-alanine amidase AmpD